MQTSLLLWILLLPLIGFLINFLVYPLFVGGMQKTNANISGTIATLFMVVSFLLSAYAFNLAGGNFLSFPVFDWVNIGRYQFSFGLELSPISSIMILIITGIGSLIHLYSIGYMHEEVGAARFFSFLNLFCFMMLMLVLSDSVLFTFFGWEGVGLCSFLLIGYWYNKEQYVQNARKAFIVNRIGDVGFVLAMFFMLFYFGSLNYSAIKIAFYSSNGIYTGLATMIGLLLFIGATGKSAQIPLYVWLPDAMVGPTPVSALIHAATMVTAGVFLCTKLNFLFVSSPFVMSIIVLIGALTALMGALIALGQSDIKKVLAYSTVSQLGFMFIAVGSGAFVAAIFHLMTHAFFKALLFLGSGSVIHGCGGEQDMNKMGGLRKKMPLTFVTMTIGALALCGIPMFSGFFSKDEILYFGLGHPKLGVVVFVLGLLASLCTALYSGRLLKLTFFDQYRGSAHVHESPWTMTLPLVILAVFATFGGLFGFSHDLSHALHLNIPHLLDNYLMSEFNIESAHNFRLTEIAVSLIASIIGVLGLVLGFKLAKVNTVGSTSKVMGILENKFYVDEIYDFLFVRSFSVIQEMLSTFLESKIFLKLGSLLASVSQFVGTIFRLTQKSGKLDTQVLVMFVGLVGVIVYFVK